MRELIALVFNYSLNGLLADPGTDFWTFCFDLLDDNGGPDQDAETMELLGGASAHLMGRRSYETFARSIPTSTDNPWAPILNAGDKVVVSDTLVETTWENSTIASGDLRENVARLRDGDGHIVVWGGVGLWRSLMELDLIDEFRISMYPYIASTGTRMFDQAPSGYRLDLVSSTPGTGGVLELRYRRHR